MAADEPNGTDEPQERFAVKFWLNSDDEKWNLHEEHWFRERPENEIVVMLLEDAKSTFAALYPEEPLDAATVHVLRLRPVDNFRPEFLPPS